MRAPVLHLGDSRVGIVRVPPLVIRALLLPLPSEPRQIGGRRRFDVGDLRELRQKVLMRLPGVAPHDAAQCRVGFQIRRVNPDHPSLDQAGLRQALHDPGEDRLVRFKVDQSPRAGDRRVVGRRLRQLEMQEPPDREESAARQAIPRAESSPSKEPINGKRK